MSKEVFRQLVRDESSVPVATPEKEGLVAKIFSDIGKELKHQAEFGAHEMAAAIFRGDAFVMYPHANQGIEQESPNEVKAIELLPEIEPEIEMEM